MMSRRYISSFWPESDGSTLTLDFTTGVLDPRLTFSRSTGGSYVHSDGLLYGFDTSSTSNTIGTGSKTFTISATAGVNRRYAVGDLIIASSGANNMSGSVTSYDPATQALACNITGTPTGSGTFTTWIIGNGQPRFDHAPDTLAPRGLLIEGQAINLLKHSQGLFTSWIQFGTVGALTTGITSPSGDSSAVSLNLNTAGNNGYYTNNTQMGYTNTVGATYTFSIWVRATGSTTNLNIRFGDSAVGYSANIPITTSWQRLQYSYVAIAASGPTIASATGTATGVVELWGAQLEAGSGASSYIPTGASQGTRNPDNCELLNLTTMGFNASAGTIYVDTGTRIGTGGRSYSFMPTSGINEQIFEGGGFLLNVYSSGTFVAQIGTGTASAAKIAAAYAVNDYAVSVNGGAPSTDTAGALPTTIAKLTIGARDSSSVTQMNGCIRVFKYWPTRLPNAQLQSLTT
jgi:hypothetical protein